MGEAGAGGAGGRAPPGAAGASRVGLCGSGFAIAMADSAKSPLMKELEAAEPFYLFAGPNVIQSEEFIMKHARQVRRSAVGG